MHVCTRRAESAIDDSLHSKKRHDFRFCLFFAAGSPSICINLAREDVYTYITFALLKLKINKTTAVECFVRKRGLNSYDFAMKKALETRACGGADEDVAKSLGLMV